LKSKHIEDMLKALSSKIPCSYVRISKRGVPHIVLNYGKDSFSICYFRTTSIWKFFHGYAEGPPKKVVTLKTYVDVLHYVEQLFDWKYPSYGLNDGHLPIRNSELSL